MEKNEEYGGEGYGTSLYKGINDSNKCYVVLSYGPDEVKSLAVDNFVFTFNKF